LLGNFFFIRQSNSKQHIAASDQMPVITDGEFYAEKPKRGEAVIFNHETYYFKAASLSLKRNGTGKDCKDLKRVLESLNFNVNVEENLNFNKIVEKIEESENS
jgi:hypothetical protein